MIRHIKTKISIMLVLALILGIAGCGQSSTTTASKEFSPKYPSDTAFKLSIVGTYSNFESLESEFERFYEHYPNGELEYTYLDDYSKTIVHALAGQEPPDIYVVQPYMYGNDEYKSLFEGAEVLSAPELEIGIDCIRPGLRWEMENGEVKMLPVFSTSYGMLVNMDIFEKKILRFRRPLES